MPPNGQLMGNCGSWSLTSRNHRLNITKVAQGAKTDPWCNDTASKLSKWSLVRFTEAFIKYLRLYFLLWSHKWDWVQFPFSFSWVMTPVQLKMSTQFNYIRTHSVKQCMFYVNIHSSSSCWTWTSFHKSCRGLIFLPNGLPRCGLSCFYDLPLFRKHCKHRKTVHA